MAPVDVTSILERQKQPESTSAIESQLALIINTNLNNEPRPGHLEAEAVGGTIDELYASGYASDDKAEQFFWTLWTFYLEVVKRVPADDNDKQQFLVDTIDRLRVKERGSVKVWRTDTRVWRDLSMLGPCMREAWNYTPKFDNSDTDNAGIKGWTGLNAFAARILGAEVMTWDNFAIWALREALETPPQNDTARDAHLGVASEWIMHAGKYLQQKSAKSQNLDDADKRALKPGKLFEGGESGLSTARWKFWQGKMETLAKETSNEEVKAKVKKALESAKSG